MPLITLPITPEGPMVNVMIGWSHTKLIRYRRAHRPVADPIKVRALVDTGAEISCIDRSIAQQLDLDSSWAVLSTTPALGGTEGASCHYLSVAIVHPSGDSRENL